MKKTMIQNIGLFCASGNEVDSCYFEESAIIGRWIGKNKKRLIYGGANVGLMEATAEHVKKHGGSITLSLCMISFRMKKSPTWPMRRMLRDL